MSEIIPFKKDDELNELKSFILEQMSKKPLNTHSDVYLDIEDICNRFHCTRDDIVKAIKWLYDNGHSNIKPFVFQVNDDDDKKIISCIFKKLSEEGVFTLDDIINESGCDEEQVVAVFEMLHENDIIHPNSVN